VLGTVVAVPPGTPPGLIPAGTPLVAAPLSFPVILDQYTTQATLQVPLTDYFYRLPRLHDAAKGSARSAALMATATRARVGSDARIAYYNWVRARLQADVAARSLAQAKAHLKDVEAANASGASSKADVLRVASQVATAELAVTRTRTAIEVTQRRVATFMHDSAARSWDVGEDVGSVPPPSPRLQQPVPQLVGEAMTNRPELKALLEAAGAARANAGAALASTLPRIDAVGNATYARPNGRIFPQEDKFKGTWDASVQLSWAPTDVFGGQSGRSAALAKARQLEEDRAALADGIELEVAQSLASLRESEAAMATSERGLLAAAEGYRVRLALFQNGRATSVELTDSETDHARAELEAIASRIDRRIAEVRLAHALGEDAHQ
jgi:outer membrane protein TolC